MTRRPVRRKRALILGFYQDKRSVRPVCAALRREKIDCVGVATLTREGKVRRHALIVGRFWPTASGLALGLLTVLVVSVVSTGIGRAWPAVVLAGLLGSAVGAGLGWSVVAASTRALLRRSRPWILKGEVLVLVKAHPSDTAPIVEALTEKGRERPPVFVVQPSRTLETHEVVARAPFPISEESASLRAEELAHQVKDVKKGPPNYSLNPRLDRCENVIKEIHDRFAGAVRLDQGVALSAEWLLDNAYVIQGHVEDFRRNLPRGYYRELPCLVSGVHAGFPRVYAIACELVTDWDARLTRESIESFLQTLQSQTILTSGELWALPIMLRLRLIEYLASLSATVEQRQTESEIAAVWANRLLLAARREPERLPAMLAEVSAALPNPTAHFVEELMGHLYDEEAALNPTRAWLQAKFPAPLDDVVRQDERDEAADQVSLANAISTLRLLSQIDWREVFEAVSHLEAILWTDPAIAYGAMDFATKDRYRHVVEQLGRRTGSSEEAVARVAVDLAREAEGDPWRHVGYYLVDEGVTALEGRLAVKPSFRRLARSWVAQHAALVYVGSILAMTALVTVGMVAIELSLGAKSATALFLAAVLVLPVSELAVQFVNFLVTRILEPRPLSKMNFEGGIPDEFRTLVVVPMMLLTPESIRAEAERLEIRALANPDPGLTYCLMADYSDAPSERMPEDLELLEVAVQSIDRLNREHPASKFLLFHRERTWCESEGCWIGWERKRGKLELLNRFLTGDPGAKDELAIKAGELEAVEGVRFVLTLDADTQLPRDTARRLVATLAHPLNRPHVAPDGSRVTRGYTVIQPRVSTSLPSATRSLFTRLFTDPTGLDPYTHAVSDVYQDLSGSASYHGKGIYDLTAFHRVLDGRFPDSHILSHDLLEGAYVRVGLASDIELLDLFPSDYWRYCDRLHRWIRGDWQILDWLRRLVPTKSGTKGRNPLPALERWKIFDNLRRSLVPAGTMAMLLVGCAVSQAAVLYAVLVGAIVMAPVLLTLLGRMTRPWKLDRIVWQEPAQNIVRVLLFTAVLPHQAAVSLDAVVRALVRRVTRRQLLEWATARPAPVKTASWALNRVVKMAWVPVFAVAAMVVFVRFHPDAVAVVVPFGVLWALSPVMVFALDRRMSPRLDRGLSTADRSNLRHIARLTWRYFDDFVGPDTHWLPPDNYQDAPRAEVAERTSPTNIGLYMLSALAAHDFGYATFDQTLNRVTSTLKTLGKVERYRGHLLNWYDTGTLEPLGERYVSMVDSANLMGCLWALRQGLDGGLDQPVLPSAALRGLSDTFVLFRQAAERSSPGVTLSPAIEPIGRLLDVHPERLEEMAERLNELAPVAAQLVSDVASNPSVAERPQYWAKKLDSEVAAWKSVLDQYLSWVAVLVSVPEGGLLPLGPSAHGLRRTALSRCPSVRSLASGTVPGLYELLAFHRPEVVGNVSEDLHQWLHRLQTEADKSRAQAQQTLALVQSAAADIEHLDGEMEMGFLYDRGRRLFAVGYNVAEQRLDRSYYDLLASEARLGSFLAIARGDVPTEHWWALGRPFGGVRMRRMLLSWNGTMFEYLLPLVLNRSYPNSLLDEACRNAIDAQVGFARSRGVPWGISESAFSALDARHVYQYRAFGVPELALRRSADTELVVAPYATALALSLNPRMAAKNLRRLATLGRPNLRADYGFYDAIDYSRAHGPQGERGVVVQAFMAHHQGMVLLSIVNVLTNQAMQERFHADARVQATVPLLFERIPVAPPVIKNQVRDVPLRRLSPIVVAPAPGRLESPDTPTPRAHLLSNGDMHVMVTNAGGGYLRWRGFDVTRWRADSTLDNWGAFCYLKDLDSGFTWSAPHQPVCAPAKGFHAVFTSDKAAFRRRDRGIDTLVEVTLSSEDDAEVRRVTLINRSLKVRRIEVTSYCELALAPHLADRSHPAFNKLFVQTAVLRDLDALLAWRRPSSPDDPPVWAAQVVTTETREYEPAQFETDRAEFVGRGHDIRKPKALDHELTGSSGYVLDPVFSIRRQITIAPGERVQLAFVTVAADSREKAVELAAKYRAMEAVHRAFQMAWTHAQLELRHLRIKPIDAQLYQQLASSVVYPDARLRTSAERIAANRLGQSRLWSQGVSGDLPIVVVSIETEGDLDVVREAVEAHEYWRMRGLVCDLVVLNDEESGYAQPLQTELDKMVASRTPLTGTDRPGGVFVRRLAVVPPDEAALLLAAARIVFVASRGSLSQQTGSPPPPALPVLKRERPVLEDEPSPELPYLELAHFNGTGGFTSDGREYIVNLEKGKSTPRPWSNVLANPSFGTLVTDEGPGFTWNGNSQSNRLTPWSNDPVSNPAGEAVYIFDTDLDVLWTPTPLPVRENDAYRTRHGQGYTVVEHNSHAVEQVMTTFVPTDKEGGDPVRIQRLKLTNRSSRKRNLVVTSYTDWVLGTDREHTQPHVVTNWDVETSSIFAHNAFNDEFSSWTAFAACSRKPTSFSGDRTEVLGRNGNLAAPAGLHRPALSGRTGGGLDPCAALQTQVHLEPNESVEIVFVLGQAQSPEAARDLVRHYTDRSKVDAALRRTRQFWDDTLGTVHVQTPVPDADLLVNRWLLYQTLSSRMWGRTGFYQSGGAYGFRDQLQDAMALLVSSPRVAREHILRCAARQFKEGDVQHWWHPQSGAGVRTRISDDLLWLPYVTAQYVRVTGDVSILSERTPFLEGKTVDPSERDVYAVPTQAGEDGDLLEHCRRAVARGVTSGPHGLPLIGGGDWNDGLNLVGAQGRGESVWLAWFAIHVLGDFAELLEATGDTVSAIEERQRAASLAKAVEACAWDGDWYLRATFDDGTPLGSHTNDEAKIDSLPQSWSAISGAGDRDRARTAMTSVDEHLVRERDGLVLLLEPPFDQTAREPGYIKGYPPGVRENGGQYTHAAVWAAMAWAKLGDGERAVRMLNLLNPISHADNEVGASRYLVEPYVVAADVYALPGRVGMGGWTWYTGSAAWMYRAWLEDVLGFKLRGTKLLIEPVVPPEWEGFTIRYLFGSTPYTIDVTNPDRQGGGVRSVVLDDVPVPERTIELVDDGNEHRVHVTIGMPAAVPAK